jgi:hypothetical protein
MTHADQLVLRELVYLEDTFPSHWRHAAIRPYHARFFRPDSLPARHQLALTTVEDSMRRLWREGMLERLDDRRAQYRVTQLGFEVGRRFAL